MTASYPRITWDWIVCELDGTHISDVTPIASAVTGRFRRNKPPVVQATMPSYDRRVSIVHTDGDPRVNAGNRLLKGYRTVDGVTSLKFRGPILQIEDTASPNVARTTLTAYGAEQLLYYRLVRNGAGAVDEVLIAAQAGNVVAKAFVDRTISAAGDVLIAANGSFATTTAMTKTFQEAMTVGEAHDQLTGTQTMDIVYTPIDGIGESAQMSIVAAQGSDKPNAIFGWAAGPHNVTGVTRTLDGTLLANDVRVAGDRPEKGDPWVTGTAVDGSSVAKYLRYETWDMIDPDVADPGLLAIVAARELALRKQPREYLRIVPTPELAPSPWDDYWLGDTIHYHQSAALRQELVDAEIRLDAITVDMRPNRYERVTEMLGRASS